MEQTVIEAADPATSTQIAEYTRTAAALADLQRRYAGVVWDCSTASGDRDARAVRKELVSLRTSLDKMRLQLNADDQARIKARNDEAKRITGEIEKLEGPVDAAIKAEEQRKEAERQRKAAEEQRRVAGLQQRIAEITDMALVGDAEACDIEQRITNLVALKIDESFQEFEQQAEAARGKVLTSLRALLAAAVQREADSARAAAERAELDRLRAEQAERERVERERQAAEAAAERQRLAEERAAFEREQAAARAAREEADRKAAAERAEADRIAREAREAEQRRLDAEAAELRRQREEQEARERAAREAAEAQARAEREAAEAAARAEREAQEAACRRVRDAAPLMLDALKQWQAAEASGDAIELQNARHAREEAITAATVADEIDALAY